MTPPNTHDPLSQARRRRSLVLRTRLLLVILQAVIALLVIGALARGQTQPTTQPATQPAGQDVDVWLERLDAVGKSLRNFTADLSLEETDNSTMLSTVRLGHVTFAQNPGDNARMKIAFDQKIIAEDQPPIKDRITYVLKEGWLIERDFRLRKQINRQVVRPGETINLLKLGEGPFPLPIGQDKQEVHQQFEVNILPAQADDPPETGVHLQLIPRAGSQFERKFGSIDVWVDARTDMPVRIAAVDRNGTTTRTTNLIQMRVNGELKDSDFDLPPLPDGWQQIEEPYGG